jgi:ADP-heptose:LPS heptosyltransferase
MTRILVIRLGALGDFVQSFAPFAAIRAHHPGAEITLLTTAPFAELARLCPWFDRIEIDARPPWWDIPGLLTLRRQLAGFDFVYDLQTSGRSSRYFRLAGRPPWSGIARGCSHPQSDPAREVMHTRERQADQLRLAGIATVPPADLSFLTERPFELPMHSYALLVPGAAPHRPAKRWPVEKFAELARILVEKGLNPVVIGAKSDANLAQIILAACPRATDLTGRTALPDLFALAAGAALAVGNDTGPMHIAAAAGCRCIVLFSGESDPNLTAPRMPDGGWPTVLRAPVLADLSTDRVVAALP